MIQISSKTLQDLEFKTVQEQLSEYCTTEKGVQKALETVPYSEVIILRAELFKVNEYKSSFLQDGKIPNHGYDIIDKEIKLLAIENTFLEALSLKKIVSLNSSVNDMLIFFKKKIELYPTLAEFASEIGYYRSIWRSEK